METTRNLDLLLETIPDSWDADKLAELLLKHIPTINEYVRATGGYSNADVAPLLQRFVSEEQISNIDLHDPRQFLTIQFSQEGVSFKKSSLGGVEYEINPREVVMAIAQALKLLEEGLGRDPGCDLNFKSTLRLITPGNMTLDWDSPMHLYPAFRFKRGNITGENIDGIVRTIREGRNKIRGAFNTEGGGIVKAAR